MKTKTHSDLTGRQLEVFLAVHDTCSLSRAAEKLDLNQSTVSHHLDKLRDNLGDALFVRSGRGIVPTDRARVLAPRIRSVLTELERLCSEVDYDPSADPEPITISGNVEGFFDIISVVRDQLRAAVPNLSIRFRELGSYLNMEAVLDEGASDIVLCVRVENHPRTLVWKTLLADELVCFYDANVRGPIETVEDYQSAEHAVIDFGSVGTSIVQGTLDELGIERRITTYAPSFAMLGDLVVGTDIIMTMRKGYRHSFFSKLAWCPSPVKFPSVHLDMVWHKRQDPSKRNQWIRRNVLLAVSERQANDAPQT